MGLKLKLLLELATEDGAGCLYSREKDFLALLRTAKYLLNFNLAKVSIGYDHESS